MSIFELVRLSRRLCFLLIAFVPDLLAETTGPSVTEFASRPGNPAPYHRPLQNVAGAFHAKKRGVFSLQLWEFGSSYALRAFLACNLLTFRPPATHEIGIVVVMIKKTQEISRYPKSRPSDSFLVKILVHLCDLRPIFSFHISHRICYSDKTF